MLDNLAKDTATCADEVNWRIHNLRNQFQSEIKNYEPGQETEDQDIYTCGQFFLNRNC